MSPLDLPDDLEPTADLLRRYTKSASQGAFTGLVRRYAGLVYATALRRTGRHAVAEEVMQLVFVDLARRAPAMAEDNRLGAWLHRRASMAASDFLKAERRRQQREQTAASLLETEDGASSWERMAPLLDDCLAGLPRPDREALVLRFFEGRSLRDVGEALGLSSDAAQKRVSRALERLREGFRRQGVVLTVAVLGGALLENARAAPVAGAVIAKAASDAFGHQAGLASRCWKALPRVAPLAAGVAVVCLASAQPLFSSRVEDTAPNTVRLNAQPASQVTNRRTLQGWEQGLSLEETVQRIVDLLVANKPDYPIRYLYFQELALASSVPESEHAVALDLLLKMLRERNHALDGNRGHFLYHTWLPALAKNDPGALLDRLGSTAPYWLLQLTGGIFSNGVRFQEDDIRDRLCRRILDDPSLSDEYIRRAAIDWLGRAGTGGGEIDKLRRTELLAECMGRILQRTGRGWALAAVAFARTDEDHVALLEAASATLAGTELAKVREAAVESWSKSSLNTVIKWSESQPPEVRGQVSASAWNRTPLQNVPAEARMAPADWLYARTSNPSTLMDAAGSRLLHDPQTWIPWLEKHPAVLRDNRSTLEHLLREQLTGFHVHPMREEAYLKTPVAERLQPLFEAWRRADPDAVAACLADTSEGTYHELREVLRSLPATR